MEWRCMHRMKDIGWTGKERRSFSRNHITSPRSHLDKEDQQELESGLWPCLKPDMAPDIPSIFNFSFLPINHFHSAIINPCLYQPISVLYCVPPHSADKGPQTETPCTVVANFMLKRSLNQPHLDGQRFTGQLYEQKFKTNLRTYLNNFCCSMHCGHKSIIQAREQLGFAHQLPHRG